MSEMKTPGEFICYLEEYLPSWGAYSDNEEVYASLVGVPRYNEDEKTVSIEAPMKVPRFNAPNSIVYGRVIQVLDQFVILQLFPYKTRRFRLIPTLGFGAIHISKIRKEFVADIREEMDVGDIVRARVQEIVKRFFLRLSTVGDNFGVIKAFCPHDRSELRLRKGELVCPVCKRKFKRKIALDYGNPQLPR